MSFDSATLKSMSSVQATLLQIFVNSDYMAACLDFMHLLVLAEAADPTNWNGCPHTS